MGTSWKVTPIVAAAAVFAFLCGGLFYQKVVLPARKARQIAGGYRTAGEAHRALRENCNDASAHVTLAHDAIKRNDEAAALKELQEAARLDPKNGYTQMDLAIQLLVLHRRDEAVTVLRALAQTDHEEAVYAARLIKKLKK